MSRFPNTVAVSRNGALKVTVGVMVLVTLTELQDPSLGLFLLEYVM